MGLQFDPVGEVTPFDDLAGNRCPICSRRVWGRDNGVPRYFCVPCFRLWAEAIQNKEPWCWALYQEEKNRRGRRSRLMTRGYTPFFNSLEEMVEKRGPSVMRR